MNLTLTSTLHCLNEMSCIVLHERNQPTQTPPNPPHSAVTRLNFLIQKDLIYKRFEKFCQSFDHFNNDFPANVWTEQRWLAACWKSFRRIPWGLPFLFTFIQQVLCSTLQGLWTCWCVQISYLCLRQAARHCDIASLFQLYSTGQTSHHKPFLNRVWPRKNRGMIYKMWHFFM